MITNESIAAAARGRARYSAVVVIVGVLGVALSGAGAQESWPPAPPLDAAAAAEDVGGLPASVVAEPDEHGTWRCTFRFRPRVAAQSVILAGSFNGWDRQANPMDGPNDDGEWMAELALSTGMHEYKFLVDGDRWLDDPVNTQRRPDGFGGHNSVLLLGRLARMKRSEASRGDGQIDAVGIQHRPPLPMYIQPLGADQVLLRYRTLAHDVQQVWVALKGGGLTEMQLVSEGPLFAYREARVAIPVHVDSRAPNVRSLEYTFVLSDGGERVGDPHTYHYSYIQSGIFETPEWAKHAVWYQIMLDRFRNGDPSNDPDPVRPWTSAWFTPSPWEGRDGQTFYEYYVFDRSYGGDLAGLEEKLPYLKELGVNAIYLNPIFKAHSFHKYHTADYLHIDDHFGAKGDYEAVAAQEDLLDPSTWKWTETDQRFIEFLKKAHAQGFKVVIDGVFNHVGTQHPAFADVKENGKTSRYADWFDITSWEPFVCRGWAGYTEMPVFKKSRQGFASETLKQHIFAVTRRWMDPNGDGDPSDGVDGWRLDVPNEIALPFWAQWRQLVKEINPEVFVTGEIWHRAGKWLDGHHFDAVMNYEFAKVAVRWMIDREHKIPASEAASRLAELRLAYPKAATYALQNLLDSHDTDRLVSMVQNPDREYDRQNRVQDNNADYDNSKPPAGAYARARLMALLQMTYVGAPMVYYGDEAGMWGADDPTCRKPMLWKDLEPYDKPEDNHVMAEHLDFYHQAIALRNAHPALRTGGFETLLTDDEADVWVFARDGAGEQLIVALNASSAPQEVQVPLPAGQPQRWQQVFGGAVAVESVDGQLLVQLEPVSGAVFHGEAP
ncbi:MAG: alpha-glucosidase C-terminal domain-containing protein [Planctomycetes bacterium]|nr:alpha-glucosidase C-terminal domain-containing protein [Planctomycetota bacterium]